MAEEKKWSEFELPRDKSTISVASLNFSGINVSYFEYNDGSDDLAELNQKYKIIKEQDSKFP